MHVFILVIVKFKEIHVPVAKLSLWAYCTETGGSESSID